MIQNTTDFLLLIGRHHGYLPGEDVVPGFEGFPNPYRLDEDPHLDMRLAHFVNPTFKDADFPSHLSTQDICECCHAGDYGLPGMRGSALLTLMIRVMKGIECRPHALQELQRLVHTVNRFFFEVGTREAEELAYAIFAHRFASHVCACERELTPVSIIQYAGCIHCGAPIDKVVKLRSNRVVHEPVEV